MRSGIIGLLLVGLLASCAPKLGSETVVLPDSSPKQTGLEHAPEPVTSSTKPTTSLATTASQSLDYALPLPNPSILSRFGEQGSGIILRTSQPGEAVYSVQSGIITEMSKFSANDGYIVTIEHANKVSTTYLNLQAVPLVKVGDKVSKHQIIGYLGGGTLTPANVLKFFASEYQNGRFSFIDPASLLHFN